MKSFILGIKDDQMNMAYVSNSGKHSNVLNYKDSTITNLGSKIDSCSIAIVDELHANIMEFVQNEKLKVRKADIVIALDALISRTIEIPFLNKKKLKMYIDHNISTFFTINMDDYYYDYKVTKIAVKNKSEQKKMTIMLVAIPKTIILGLKNLMSSVGIMMKSVKIYPDTMSLLLTQNESFAVIDIGFTKTIVSIYNQGVTFLYTSLETGFEKDDPDSIHEFIDDIENLTDFYSARNQGERLDGIYVFGELEDDLTFESMLTERLQSPILKLRKKHELHEKKSSRFVHHPYLELSQQKHKNLMDETIDFSQVVTLQTNQKKEFSPSYVFLILTLVTVLWFGGYWYYLNQQSNEYIQATDVSENYVSLESELSLLLEKEETLSQMESTIRSIESSEVDCYLLVRKLQDIIPVGVSIRTLSLEKEKVNVEFNFDGDTLTALELVIQINEQNFFEDISIEEIKLNDKIDTMSFELIPIESVEGQ